MVTHDQAKAHTTSHAVAAAGKAGEPQPLPPNIACVLPASLMRFFVNEIRKGEQQELNTHFADGYT